MMEVIVTPGGEAAVRSLLRHVAWQSLSPTPVTSTGLDSQTGRACHSEAAHE